MTFDASLRKDVRRMEKEASLAEANRLAYTKQIMSDAFGRKWMYDLLVRCHIWHTSFVAGQPDNTAFRLGEQNIGLSVFADVMTAAPADYVLMMNEANLKDQVHDRRYSDERTAANELPRSPDAGRDVERSVDYDPFAERSED